MFECRKEKRRKAIEKIARQGKIERRKRGMKEEDESKYVRRE